MPIQAAANRLKRELASGNISSNQPSAEELKKNPKMKKPEPTQYEIMSLLGIPAEEIPEFAVASFWPNYFTPKAMDDLKDFGAHIDWRRTFYTTDANPFFDSFIRW